MSGSIEIIGKRIKGSLMLFYLLGRKLSKGTVTFYVLVMFVGFLAG